MGKQPSGVLSVTLGGEEQKDGVTNRFVISTGKKNSTVRRSTDEDFDEELILVTIPFKMDFKKAGGYGYKCKFWDVQLKDWSSEVIS